jgi:4-amino-4-deoxy-L-arabinose transferase-like glycosyltransferase
VFLPALGATSLERAEIYFLDGARSMVETGDWLVPRYRGEPFFDKPALTYWLIAAAFRVFGPSEAAGRLVPALAALGLAFVTLWLGRLLLERTTALAGSVVLLTTLGVMTFGRVAMSDMLLALFSTLAFALAVRLFAGEAPVWTLPALGAVLGLGFQTKGPVAVLLPGLGIALLAWRRPLPRFRALPLVLAAALLALLGLGWYVLVFLRLGTAPLEHFFLRENVQRFAAETYDSGRPPWYYLGVYLAEGAPWSPFLVPALLGFRKTRDATGWARGVRLLLLWAALMLVPLSLSRGKIDYYILPLYPALGLTVAHVFFACPWGALERVFARAALLVLAAGALFVPIALSGLPERWLGRAGQAAPAAAAVIATAALALAAVQPGPARVFAALAGSSALLFVVTVTTVVPAFVGAQPNAAVVRSILRERAFEPRAQVVACSDPTRVQRDLLFQARIAVIERCDLWSPASSGRPFLLLLQRNEKKSLQALRRYRTVGAWEYLPATVVNVERVFSPEVATLFLAANYPSRDPAVRRHERLMRERARRLLRRHGEREERASEAEDHPDHIE